MKNKIVKLLLSLTIILSAVHFFTNDLRNLYKLHYANKLVVTDIKTKTDFVIETEELPKYIQHIFYEKKESGVNYKNWEKVYDIDFYDNEKFIMNGSIIRLKKLESNDVSINPSGYEDYYYKFSIDVKNLRNFFIKKTYYAKFEDELIALIFEHKSSD